MKSHIARGTGLHLQAPSSPQRLVWPRVPAPLSHNHVVFLETSAILIDLPSKAFSLSCSPYITFNHFYKITKEKKKEQKEKPELVAVLRIFQLSVQNLPLFDVKTLMPKKKKS